MKTGISRWRDPLFLLALVIVGATWQLATAAIDGTGTVTGRVSAARPFRAAQVYLRNIDKRTLYMVYTAEGRYEAPNLIPGSYEVSVKKNGFTTDVRKLQVSVGSNLTADFLLLEGPNSPAQLTVFNGPAGARSGPVQVAYDDLYPAGPGKAVVERTCVSCHGVNFLPRRQWTQESATAAMNLMTGTGVSTGRGVGTITPEMMGPQDRQLALSYIVANFGRDKPPRSLKTEEYPLDEQVLGRAMYIEYYAPLDPPRVTPRLQEPRIGIDGNVWYTDLGAPNHIGMVDPRTAEFKVYPLPGQSTSQTCGLGGECPLPHGLTVDMQGNVFWAEVNGFHLGRLDPKTGQMTRYDMNIDGKSKGSMGHTPNLDSKGDVWFSVIIGNKIGKWDRAAQKIVALYEPPTRNSMPYGTFIDKNDKIWFFEYAGCRIGRFDPFTEAFTEWPALTQPCQIRRGSMDSKGTVWFGIWSAGKLGKLDPETGRVAEYKLPLDHGQPYNAWPDHEDNIWMGDDGQGGSLVKFDPKTETFTYYPAPQSGDMPNLAISRDGSIWYTPRSAANAAVGVLHPDKTQMTTLAAVRRDPSRDQ
jgi:virginiamycin B lyase